MTLDSSSERSFVGIFLLCLMVGFMWAAGCGSEEGQDPDVGFDVDLQDADGVFVNRCGGDEILIHDDEEVESGDSCGPCDDGVIVCDGEEEVRCAVATAANECGGCEPLPGRAGEPCGPCDSGSWACDGEGSMICVDALEHNACGGCGELEAQPTTGCDGEAGEFGVWGCTGPEAVRCVLPGENACGGPLDLEEEPGTNCGTCDGGVWACEAEDSVTCTNPDYGINVCGGCDPLFGVLGDECGVCEGEWACDGPEDVFCDEDPLNACGGCGELSDGLPGHECAPNTIYICEDPNTLYCPDEPEDPDEPEVFTNPCGGDEELDNNPGDSCGECGDGEMICVASNDVACVGASSLNACDGCGELAAQPGDVCGPCGLDTVVCDGQEATSCDGATPCPVLEIETSSAQTISAQSATFSAEITELPIDDVTDHGFCWSRDEQPTPINGECHSLGSVDQVGSFEFTTDELRAGRTYFVRAFATVGSSREYAGDIGFSPDAEVPEGVEVSDGDHTDYVEISWEPDEAEDVEEFVIYRDGDEIATVDASAGSFEDTEAAAGEAPMAPENVVASDQTSTEYVLVSWDTAEVPDAEEHLYEVEAVYPDATSELSEEFVGSRAIFEVDDYELSVDDGDWFDVGLVEEYEDEQAPMATITPGEASASAGDFETHVALEHSGTVDVESHPASYRVRALNEAGEGAESQEAHGERDVDDTLYYQWFYSDEDNPVLFDALFSPATDDGGQYDDDSAPSDGSIRSYYLAISAAGAATVNTDVVTGFRSADASLTTEPVTAVDTDEATFHANLVELGSPPPSAHGFCYGTMADPTHGSGADCTDFGSLDSSGSFEQTVGGLSGGTTYFVRAYITNADGTSYGAVEEFLTLAEAPTGLVASSEPDHVALSWDAVSGAEEYRIERDGTAVATVTATSYDDTGAEEGSAPQAPTLTATSGTYADRVELSWDEPGVDGGAVHTYQVVAINDGGDGEASETAEGNRSGYPVTSYELQIDGGSWSGVGSDTSFEDSGADAPSIEAGVASASDGEFAEYVALELDGTDTAPGDESTYRVRAVNETGSGEESATEGGNLDLDMTELSYQWFASDDGSGGPYSSITSASAESSHDDYAAPDDGSVRHYYVEVNAEDIPSDDSDTVSGFRASEAEVLTRLLSGIGIDEATFHGEIIDLGDPDPTQHGFCYGTMSDPTHDTGADCTELGAVSTVGTFQDDVGGLSPDTDYNVRAYATTTAGAAYGSVQGFTTLPEAPESPTNLVATSDPDHVELNWDSADRADGYRVYRNGTEITTEPIAAPTYDDAGADEGAAPDAPPSFDASSGDHEDEVVITWNEPSADDGTTHTYHVVAVNDGGESDPSATADGNRDAYPVTSYELEIDGGSWSDVGDITLFSDDGADAPTIEVGNVTASQGEFVEYVALAIDDATALPGDPSTYRVRAVNSASEVGAISGPEDGHIGVGELSTEWQRTDEDDSTAGYFAIAEDCVDDFTCDDTTAPEDGSTRYYRVEANASGVVGPVYSDPPVAGYRDELFCGGDGTSEEPYQICTANHLNEIGTSETYLNRSFRLAEDIDMEGVDFNIIGDVEIWDSREDPFVGEFDGDGHVISNLVIDEPDDDYIALFGYVGDGADIRDLTLQNVEMTGYMRTGGLIGWNEGEVTGVSVDGSVTGVSTRTGSVGAGGLVGVNWGTIDDAHVSGAVTGSLRNVGGLVGYNAEIVTNSHAASTVSGSQDSIGGFAGRNTSSGLIETSYATGAVTGTGGGDTVGGFVGRNQGTISESHATGDATGDEMVGGFVGEIHDGVIERSYAVGDVDGPGNIMGGLAGNNRATIEDSFATGSVAGDASIGGLVGTNVHEGIITDSYATGSVTGNNDVGGLVGEDTSSAPEPVTTSYWDVDTSGISETDNDSGVGDPLQTAEFDDDANFDGWDFASIWVMGLDAAETERPRLQWANACENDADC